MLSNKVLGKLQSLAAKDAKVAEQIVSRVISNKELSPEGTIRLANASGGPPLTITTGKYLYLNNFYIYILKESLDYYEMRLDRFQEVYF